MLTKVLDYEFNINGQPIDKSGQSNHGHPTAITFSIDAQDGTRAAGYLAEQSRIVVPHNSSWNELTAVRVDARVRLNTLARRANLVEIERSLALFVRKDGVVSFTFYRPKDNEDEDDGRPDLSASDTLVAVLPDGSHDPFDTLTSTPPPDEEPPQFKWDGVNTDASFAPNGQRRTVPLNQYVTISAVHDGLSTMRIFINGELAGARYDIRHAVPPLLAPGIVAIGAWPHDNRYTLNGSLDFVRIWRHDPRFLYRQFFCRPMSDETRKCWHTILRYLTDSFDDEGRSKALRDLLACFIALQTRVYRAIAQNGEQSLLRLQRYHRQYMQLWCDGDIGGQAMAVFQQDFLGWLRREIGTLYDDIFTDTLQCLTKAQALDYCGLKTDIRRCDPAWAAFLDNIIGGMPNPLCPPRPTGGDPYCPPPPSGADGTVPSYRPHASGDRPSPGHTGPASREY